MPNRLTRGRALVGALNEELIQYRTVVIPHHEVLTLRATPKTLVLAPGAGKVLEFVSAVLELDYSGGVAYTETDDNLAIKYTNGSGAAVSQAIEATAFISATATTLTTALPKIDAIVASVNAINKPLVLHNTGNGEYEGGAVGNGLRVRLAYRVHTVAPAPGFSVFV